MRNKSTAEATLVMGLYEQYGGRICLPLVRSDFWNPSLWRLPGGGVELGEFPIVGAGREVFEETGLIVQGLRHVNVIKKHSRDPTLNEHQQHIYVGEIPHLDGLRKSCLDGGERLFTELFFLDDVLFSIRNHTPLLGQGVFRKHAHIIKSLSERLFG